VDVQAEEKLLIEQLLGRQRSAWDEFVARYQKVICAQVHRTARQCNRTFNAADFEDVCAEVFALLLANDMASLRAFRGASSLATWLTVIARRICLRQIDRAPQERPAAHLEKEVPSPATSNDALEQLIQDEETRQLGTSLDQMRDGDRELLGLFFEQRLSYQEISERLGISINSVGPKLQRAQKRLRKLMNQQ
jgi:RNA polymerase sigma-70 factor (ECF subfamily)